MRKHGKPTNETYQPDKDTEILKMDNSEKIKQIKKGLIRIKQEKIKILDNWIGFMEKEMARVERGVVSADFVEEEIKMFEKAFLKRHRGEQ